MENLQIEINEIDILTPEQNLEIKGGEGDKSGSIPQADWSKVLGFSL